MKRCAALLTIALTLLLALPADASTVTAGDTKNGKAVSLRVGDRLTVTLGSTYWTIRTPHGHALRADGPQTTAAGRPGPGCYGGTGCGTASRTFTGHVAGTVTLLADRTTCGEALQCAPAQRSYRLTVHVTALPVVAPTRLPLTGAHTALELALGGLLIGTGAVALRLGATKEPTQA